MRVIGHVGVSIPQSGFRPCGPRPMSASANYLQCFNPSVGIPSMWTSNPGTKWNAPLKFQSLSRDSVHVDVGVSRIEQKIDQVSIPQSGFRPCGLHGLCRRRRDALRFNPSVGIPSMWTQRTVWEQARHGVSIPQSGFRPCGPGVGCARISTDRLVSIPQSGFRPCGPITGALTDLPAGMFQSLSRDSVHVDRDGRRSGGFRERFQSLSRDSVHVDLIARSLPFTEQTSFNPSVGIPSMWT